MESLREQLRNRGYLSHGIERWFALDPWRSRTFWVELLVVALKAALLIAPFGALTAAGVMLIRNFPLGLLETLQLFVIYAAAMAAATLALVMLVGLLLKVRPELAIETPRALLGIGMAASTMLVALLAIWWYGFGQDPSLLEVALAVAMATLLFIVGTIVVSAALLSFSIHELQRIPTIHQKPRTMPVAAAAAVLVAGLLVLAYATPEAEGSAPPQVATAPTTSRIALIAVDGLTEEIVRSRQDLTEQFVIITRAATIPARSPSERWASVGTGVPATLHGVRAVAGIRLAGGRSVLQSISRWDYALMVIAPALRVAQPQPLPPTVRRREFVWEILASRNVPAAAVNWWTSEESRTTSLSSVPQSVIFAGAANDPLRVDSAAVGSFFSSIDGIRPRFATMYLPALDVVLNRLDRGRAEELALSLRALDGVAAAIAETRKRGYEVIVAGAPGPGQTGHGVIAASLQLRDASTLYDVAPTILETMGFPASNEMPGRSLAGRAGEPRIASYGTRAGREGATKLDQEYYESLRSLGYIQ